MSYIQRQGFTGLVSLGVDVGHDGQDPCCEPICRFSQRHIHESHKLRAGARHGSLLKGKLQYHGSLKRNGLVFAISLDSKESRE